MICRVQVRPPSNETPSNNPTTPMGRTDIATMFEGFVGLTAMASSASFPPRALTLTFVGIWVCAAPAGMPRETSRARDNDEMLTRNVRVRMIPPSLTSNPWVKVRHPKRSSRLEQQQLPRCPARRLEGGAPWQGLISDGRTGL